MSAPSAPLPRSLFVIGLPRSLTSLVVGQAAGAVGLRLPSWTSAGEILNPGRYFSCRAEGTEHERFLPPEDTFMIAQYTAFLDDAVRPDGHAYKDVVQPFAVASWLHGKPVAVLRIARPLADVALAMSRLDWSYPARAARDGPAADAMLRGLLRADRTLAAVAGETVRYDDLVADEHALSAAMSRLYPGTALGPVRYVDDAFARYRADVMARRETPDWHRLQRGFERLGADRDAT